MPNLFINLRKKLILPFKWKRKEKRMAGEAYIPTGQDLIELKKLADNKRIVYLRRGDKLGISRLEGTLSLLDAFLSNTLEEYKKSL